MRHSLSHPLRGVFLATAVAALTMTSSGLQAQALPPVTDIGTVRIKPKDSGLPADWHRGAFIEIYVRAYQDSNGDGIGDLNGLISRLDYLQSLGVKGIWLMPVAASQDRDHGYAVKDYRSIEPDYGTLADFDRLLAEAHQRGIGVIMDYVINHSAAQHPAFLQSASSTTNPYRDWYRWEASAPKGWEIFGRDPWVAGYNGAYLAQFSPTMPDFHILNPKVVNFHLDNLRFWLNRGVDGFRFDAVSHLIENGNKAWYDQPGNAIFMEQVIKELNAHYPNRYHVCEATSGADAFAKACGAAFAFGLQYDLIKAARGDKAALRKVSTYFNGRDARFATFLSNHDMPGGARSWDQLKGDLARVKLAASSYLLLPGTPFIYYGEEIGQGGAPALGGDWQLRTPMSWDASGAAFSKAKPFRAYADNLALQNVAAEQNRGDSLLAHYRALITLRHRVEALRLGDYRAPVAADQAWAFQRVHGAQTALVALNMGDKPTSLRVKGLPPSRVFSLAYPATALEIASDANGEATLNLPALSTSVFVIRP